MADTVTVVYLIAGSVLNQTLTADRITWQRHGRRGVMVRLWQGGQVYRCISYRRAETVDQTTGDPGHGET